MSKCDLTAELVREYLNYDPDTGVFTWRKKSSPKSVVGAVAGDAKPNGYRTIQLLGCRNFAHRLAWFYVYGVWPKHHIDHINGVRDDNRIANLRDVTQQHNVHNERKPRRGNPYLGVSYSKDRDKYLAQIYANGKAKNLGRYDTPEEAYAVYIEAKRKLHAGCTI